MPVTWTVHTRPHGKSHCVHCSLLPVGTFWRTYRAMHRAVLIEELLSVCLSVILRYCAVMAKHIEIISLHGRPIVVLYLALNDVTTVWQTDGQTEFLPRCTALRGKIWQFSANKSLYLNWKRMQYMAIVSTETLIEKSNVRCIDLVISDDLG